MPSASMSSASPPRGSGQNPKSQSSPIRGRKPVRDSDRHEIKIQNASRSTVHIQPQRFLRPISFSAELNNGWTSGPGMLSPTEEYYLASETLSNTLPEQTKTQTPQLRPFSHSSVDLKRFELSNEFSSSGALNLQAGIAESQRPLTAPSGDITRAFSDGIPMMVSDDERQARQLEPLQYFHAQKPVKNQSPQPTPRVRRIPEPLNLDVENLRPYMPPVLNHGNLRSVSSNPAFDQRVRVHSPAAGLHIPQSPALRRVSSAHSNGSHRSSAPESPLFSPVFKPLAESNTALRGHVGTHALLLSTKQTIDMYRKNLPKGDQETAYAFAMLLIDTSEELGYSNRHSGSSESLGAKSETSGKGRGSPDGGHRKQFSAEELHQQAYSVLKTLAGQSNPYAQYYLGDGYSTGYFCKGRKRDDGKALPLFIAASKRGHAESAYRAALCYEFGWGTKVDPSKAIEFLRVSAAKAHPGATTRLGLSLLRGDLGQKQYKEGLKWLKRAVETASFQYNSAPYELGLLYEDGYGDDIFKDEQYAAQLLTKSAGLGHADAAFKLGEAYEHGILSCPMDPQLSLHFYTCAAQGNNSKAMMALCALYLMGVENFLEENLDEAFEWAMKAAELGLPKAEYTVGYFRENGIGCRQSTLEANVWYVRAAEHGDERAITRLENINRAAEGEEIVGWPARKAVHRNRLVKAMSSSRSLSSFGSNSRNSSTTRIGAGNNAHEEGKSRNGNTPSHFLTVPRQADSRAPAVQPSSPHRVTTAGRRFSLGESPQKAATSTPTGSPQKAKHAPRDSPEKFKRMLRESPQKLRKRAERDEDVFQDLGEGIPSFVGEVERDEGGGDGRKRKNWLGGLWN